MQKSAAQIKLTYESSIDFLHNSWEESIVEFDETIYPEILSNGCMRFSEVCGKLLYLDTCKTKQHLVFDADNSLISNLLMPHNLALGFDSIREIMLEAPDVPLVRQSWWRSGIKNLFRSRRLENEDTPGEPKYFLPRISSPALSHWLIDALIPYLECRLIHPDIIFCMVTSYFPIKSNSCRCLAYRRTRSNYTIIGIGTHFGIA